MTMKPMRSPETIRLRRELAQFLRRLREIRRHKLAVDELAARVNLALARAGSSRRCIVVSDATGSR
jgi:hypothetical protein